MSQRVVSCQTPLNQALCVVTVRGKQAFAKGCVESVVVFCAHSCAVLCAVLCCVLCPQVKAASDARQSGDGSSGQPAAAGATHSAALLGVMLVAGAAAAAGGGTAALWR